MKLILALVLILFSGLTLGGVAGSAPASPTTIPKTFGSTVSLTWIAPLLYDDEVTPIGAQPLANNIYSAAPGAPWQLLTGGVVGLTWTSPPLVRGTICYVVTDFAAPSTESLPSNVVCFNVPPGVPDPPKLSGK